MAQPLPGPSVKNYEGRNTTYAGIRVHRLHPESLGSRTIDLWPVQAMLDLSNRNVARFMPQ